MNQSQITTKNRIGFGTKLITAILLVAVVTTGLPEMAGIPGMPAPAPAAAAGGIGGGSGDQCATDLSATTACASGGHANDNPAVGEISITSHRPGQDASFTNFRHTTRQRNCFVYRTYKDSKPVWDWWYNETMQANTNRLALYPDGLDPRWIHHTFFSNPDYNALQLGVLDWKRNRSSGSQLADYLGNQLSTGTGQTGSPYTVGGPRANVTQSSLSGTALMSQYPNWYQRIFPVLTTRIIRTTNTTTGEVTTQTRYLSGTTNTYLFRTDTGQRANNYMPFEHVPQYVPSTGVPYYQNAAEYRRLLKQELAQLVANYYTKTMGWGYQNFNPTITNYSMGTSSYSLVLGTQVYYYPGFEQRTTDVVQYRQLNSVNFAWSSYGLSGTSKARVFTDLNKIKAEGPARIAAKDEIVSVYNTCKGEKPPSSRTDYSVGKLVWVKLNSVASSGRESSPSGLGALRTVVTAPTATYKPVLPVINTPVTINQPTTIRSSPYYKTVVASRLFLLVEELGILANGQCYRYNPGNQTYGNFTYTSAVSSLDRWYDMGKTSVPSSPTTSGNITWKRAAATGLLEPHFRIPVTHFYAVSTLVQPDDGAPEWVNFFDSRNGLWKDRVLTAEAKQLVQTWPAACNFARESKVQRNSTNSGWYVYSRTDYSNLMRLTTYIDIPVRQVGGTVAP